MVKKTPMAHHGDITRFPSKVDGWFLGLVLLGGFAFVYATSTVWLRAGVVPAVAMVLVGLLTLGLPLWLLFGTDYALTAQELRVRSGPFRWRVPLDQVRRVSVSHNWLSAPALSLKRLRIDYGRAGSLLISPRDRQAFVAALQRSCPGLESPKL